VNFKASLEREGWCHSGQPGAPALIEIVSRLNSNGVQMLGAPKLLRPLSTAAAPPNSMSSEVGFGEQPLHTDCATWPRPPRFLLLQCRAEGRGSVVTNILSMNWSILERARPKVLFEQIWVFQAAGFSGTYGSIVQPMENNQYRLRFDPLLMKSQLHAVSEALLSLKEFGRTWCKALAVGEWLLVDNWRCLHSRGPVPGNCTSRAILRSYWG
jgi:hypothetical protein